MHTAFFTHRLAVKKMRLLRTIVRHLVPVKVFETINSKALFDELNVQWTLPYEFKNVKVREREKMCVCVCDIH
jgi:hypothetical protein